MTNWGPKSWTFGSTPHDHAARKHACSTHPRLSGLQLLARGMSIRFRRPANGGVQAHAEITEEMANAVEEDVARKGRADLDVPVVIYNGQGTVVAEMLATYHFRSAKPGTSAIE